MKKLGFSLMEIVIVMVVMGILGSVIYSNFGYLSTESHNLNVKNDSEKIVGNYYSCLNLHNSTYCRINIYSSQIREDNNTRDMVVFNEYGVAIDSRKSKYELSEYSCIYSKNSNEYEIFNMKRNNLNEINCVVQKNECDINGCLDFDRYQIKLNNQQIKFIKGV